MNRENELKVGLGYNFSKSASSSVLLAARVNLVNIPDQRPQMGTSV